MYLRILGAFLFLFLVCVDEMASAQTDDSILVIPNSGSECSVPQPPRMICGTWICLTGGNEWVDVPRAAGSRCNLTTGYCNGRDTDVCYTSETGSIYPTYYISSVIYVPPGAGSSVEYGTGSTIGTTTSTTDSWKNFVQVEVANGANFFGLTAGQVKFSFGNEWGGSTTTSVDVQATVSGSLKVPAQQSDLINHNYDQILLQLGPQIDATVTRGIGHQDQVQWALNFSNALPQVLLVGWLNGAMVMPSNVARTLSQYGIGTRDYPEILKAHPFVSDTTGTGTPDPVFFVL